MLLAFGQRLLNEQIRASTAARERLGELEGKRFAVVVKGSDLRVVVESAAGELKLSKSADAACDVELSAGAFDLLKLARSASLAELKGAGATLSGDIHVAEAFAELMRLATPDPEAALAGFVGDMPAHALGQAARGAVGFTRRAGRALEQNVAEYLQEERPTLAPPPLARAFSADVERLRDDVERAERRIALLERRHGPPKLPKSRKPQAD
jgi:ubiquinone biosynthesis protein UbiJ